MVRVAIRNAFSGRTSIGMMTASSAATLGGSRTTGVGTSALALNTPRFAAGIGVADSLHGHDMNLRTPSNKEAK